ncbi:MAG: hypothetical protein ACO1OT_07820 [Heyndrickxia sp.]
MKYTNEELVRDVNIGHEMEFKFNGKLYGMINVEEGSGLGEDTKNSAGQLKKEILYIM